jgi:hypothetical protein
MRTPMTYRKVLASMLLVSLQASVIWYGAPPLFHLARLARSLVPLSSAQRCDELFGSWYVEAKRLRAVIPRDAVVDIVMVSPSARDIAVLGGATLQPCRCQYFDGWTAWQRRERAMFLHDERAANAAPDVPVRPAQVVIEVNPAATPAFRLTRDHG